MSLTPKDLIVYNARSWSSRRCPPTSLLPPSRPPRFELPRFGLADEAPEESVTPRTNKTLFVHGRFSAWPGDSDRQSGRRVKGVFKVGVKGQQGDG